MMQVLRQSIGRTQLSWWIALSVIGVIVLVILGILRISSISVELRDSSFAENATQLVPESPIQTGNDIDVARLAPESPVQANSVAQVSSESPQTSNVPPVTDGLSPIQAKAAISAYEAANPRPRIDLASNERRYPALVEYGGSLPADAALHPDRVWEYNPSQKSCAGFQHFSDLTACYVMASSNGDFNTAMTGVSSDPAVQAQLLKTSEWIREWIPDEKQLQINYRKFWSYDYWSQIVKEEGGWEMTPDITNPSNGRYLIKGSLLLAQNGEPWEIIGYDD